MAKQVWQCERCGENKDSEVSAVDCENYHKSRDNAASIKGMGWKPGGWETPGNTHYPQTVVVQFSGERNDFAVYERVRIGPRGV